MSIFPTIIVLAAGGSRDAELAHTTAIDQKPDIYTFSGGARRWLA
jgi:hypothetical protein